jgi:hypothetical protein
MKTKDRFNNINNNKNIIYINLQKPTVKRRKESKNSQEQQQESYNQPSDLHPTLYRPIIYDNSSPNMGRPADENFVLRRGAEKSFISMGSPEEVMNVESNFDEIEDKQQEERLAEMSSRKKAKSAISPDRSPKMDFATVYANDEILADTSDPSIKKRGKKGIDYSALSHAELLEKIEKDKQKRRMYAENSKQKKELEKSKKLKEAEDQRRSESVRLSSDEIREKRAQNFAPFVMSSTATNFR